MPLAQPAARAEPQELSQRLAVDCAERVKPPAQLPLPGAERAEAAGRPARMQMPLAEFAARTEPQELSQRLAVDCAERVKPPAQLQLPGAERAEAAGRPARTQMPLAEPAARGSHRNCPQRLAVDCAERAMPPAQLPLLRAERAEAVGRLARMRMPLAQPAARVL